MKRFLVLLSLVLGVSGFAIASEYSDFMKSLKLSETKETKINEIEKKYKYETAQLRANVILRNMQMAKYGANPKGQNMLNSGFSDLQDEIDELQKRKEDEIVSTLGIIQKFKYRSFCRKHLCN